MAYTGYVVSDAFVETEQDGSPVIHVELLTIDDLREMIGTDEE